MIFLLISVLVFASFSINIPLCSSGSVVLGFKDTQSIADSTTKVSLCHDKKKLYVNWESIDE